MYGAQANPKITGLVSPFENDVEMYGAQAWIADAIAVDMFENDVEMYGAQAKELYSFANL